MDATLQAHTMWRKILDLPQLDQTTGPLFMLDPGLAFGTGTHPTTFLCLQWLASARIHNRTVIDYGCGSGILGIAALLHGAKSVVGIDIDPQAIVATRQNVRRNNLQESRFPIHLPEKFSADSADIVFANILAGPLVDLADCLVALLKPTGKICLSGILSAQKQLILDTYSRHIDIEFVLEMDEWVCVTGSRVS